MRELRTWQTYLLTIIIISIVLITGCRGCRDGTGQFVEGVLLPPIVTSTDPANLGTEVATNKVITATFNKPMLPSTIASKTFVLTAEDGTVIAGMVEYTDLTANFTPAGNLSDNATFTATITSGVMDTDGNSMVTNYVWNFTTGESPDNIAPTVTLTDPVNNATDVATNKKIAATFSESMLPSTIATKTFTIVKSGGTAITGTVSYVGLTANFTPAGNLASNATYTGIVNIGAKDLSGNDLAENYVWSFSTGESPDTSAPSVTANDPLNAETDVAVNKKIAATFNESMDASTINTTNFKVKGPGGVAVAGTVNYIGMTANFTPTSNLAFNTIYTATIATGAKDLAANRLAESYTWNFTTGEAPDTSAPSVTANDPLNAETDVAVNKKIAATFNESMDASTINTTNFKVKGPGGITVTGTVNYIGMTANFTPTSNLAFNTIYTATIATGAKDLAANRLTESYTWNFTTGEAPDTSAPVVIETNASGAINIGVKEAVTVTFSENMDSTTITNTTFTLTGPGLSPISGLVTYDGLIATFTPAADLPDNTVFTATIATGAKDLAGNELANTTIWTFKTGQSAPVLGRANSFALIASTKINGTTGSQINGNVGVSPGAMTSMTLSSAEINGDVYSETDQAILDAKADLRAAYDGAKLKATNVVQIAQTDIGGTTFFPGLYKAPTSFDITIGNLTIDAQGNPNAVFIFQMESTLTMATGRQIILVGNAKASNIYWQVGSSATLNTSSIFKGNILANVSITVNNSSNIEGRLLASAGTDGAGAVTFNSSIITIPAP